MNSSDDFSELEDELRALSDALAVPEPSPPSAIASAVRATLEREPARQVRRWPRIRRRIIAIVAAFLVVLVAATPQGRAAVVSILRFAGVEIRVGEPAPLPSGSPSPLPGERRVSLADARAQVRFPLVVPAVLGDPADVRVADGGRVVSMFWPGVRLDQYDGRLQELWRKELGPPWPEDVFVDGVTGVWIQQQHGLQYSPGAGPPQEFRLSGPTLIWQRGQVGIRLEGPKTVEEARRIGNSVR
ncbi:hypothetical protein Acor_26010 [Acrocarpospora corrugata]|uniref:DUF4367 domain-containing protein n=1 Tax=Acrocarpospora corrugata TaxID=35763 RepID=A0A5M3VUR8_9ACTN|nr:hypothetical protein [Acrocarpospora corrugata]GES00537.1 hypothetical protein Acor_26010 [Acrocarpospora corrugata]